MSHWEYYFQISIHIATREFDICCKTSGITGSSELVAQRNRTLRLTESLRGGLDNIRKHLWAHLEPFETLKTSARPVQASSLDLRFYNVW